MVAIAILGQATSPDTTGNCFQIPATETTNAAFTNNIGQLWVFKDVASTSSLMGRFVVPRTPVSSTFRLLWTSKTTTGVVRWSARYRVISGDDTTSLDQAMTQETVSVSDTAPGAARRRMSLDFTLTNSNFSAGATVAFVIERLGNDGADNHADSALLEQFLYDDGT